MRTVSSVGSEHYFDRVGVTGSSPVRSTTFMASVYILYSASRNKFYVGSCKEIMERLDQHIFEYFHNAFTSKVKDWIIYFHIDNLAYSQARKIELHIKRMKSKNYIENLKKYPGLSSKLIALYKE